jgi:hypothetical protein
VKCELSGDEVVSVIRHCAKKAMGIADRSATRHGERDETADAIAASLDVLLAAILGPEGTILPANWPKGLREPSIGASASRPP